MVDVVDEVGVGIDLEAFEGLARKVLRETWVSEDADLTILFVDEDEMAKLNLNWMGEQGPTDVLSFPMDELSPGTEEEPVGPGLLGDVVVCPAVAARQAAEAGHPVEREVGLLVVHGVLHLLGYDHSTPDEEREMFGLQARILGEFATEA
ncbi:MAG: rRNA maturation RNase YbeY [Demequinaceae bacterium]|nr:rRNA maturation RNase YbeY [Demequinaceae bacterium]